MIVVSFFREIGIPIKALLHLQLVIGIKLEPETKLKLNQEETFKSLCLFFQIDYVDGRARTERITDSSSTTISTSHSVNNNGLITEVTIQPHHAHEAGTFVDSSDGGSGSSPPPPPHPPRMPASYHHLHLRHGHHRLHHHHGHHIHSSIPPGRPPSGSGGDSSGYHSSGGQQKTNLRSSRSSDSSSAYR